VKFQIHLLPAEHHAFHSQPEPLFSPGLKAQFDLAACAHYTVPGKAIGWAVPQQSRHCAVQARVSGRRRHLPVRGYFPFGNRKNHAPERCITQFTGFQQVDFRSAAI